MKRREVIRKIATEAKRQGTDRALIREGANHTIYSLAGKVIPIPRHTELGDMFAVDIFKECQDVLGTGWWRK